MTMIAHALSVKRTESIVITGMHDFVVHSVGGKMAEKNHRGVRIVTLGIFRGDSVNDICMTIFGCVCVIAIAYMVTHTAE